jgi:WD40 repeat protein
MMIAKRLFYPICIAAMLLIAGSIRAQTATPDTTLPAVVLQGHTDSVTTVAWSPDGKTLASGSFDGTIRLWQADGAPILTMNEDSGYLVMQVAWSPDGKLLADGGLAGTERIHARIWKPDGTPVYTLPTKYSGGKFYNIGWSPDGKYLVGGAIDYTEWKIADGTAVFSHESCAHCTPAWGFAWSPDSTKWAMGNESGDMWIYGVDGTLIQQMNTGNGNADALAWSTDSQWLAGGNVALFGLDGSRQGLRGPGARVASIAWSPDGKWLAVGAWTSGIVYLWDAGGKLHARLGDHRSSVRQVAWSPDSTILASASDDMTIRLWQIAALTQEGQS